MVSDRLQAYDLFSRAFKTNDLFILLIYTLLPIKNNNYYTANKFNNVKSPDQSLHYPHEPVFNNLLLY